MPTARSASAQALRIITTQYTNIYQNRLRPVCAAAFLLAVLISFFEVFGDAAVDSYLL